MSPTSTLDIPGLGRNVQEETGQESLASTSNAASVAASAPQDVLVDSSVTAEDVGMTSDSFEQSKRAVGSVWCEQKWTDIVLRHLVNQVGETSAVHGRTLHEIRLRYRFRSCMIRMLTHL